MRLLLLAGTREARLLAQHLATEPGIEATASLAGVTTAPAALALPTRHGGFGGAEGLTRWLVETRTEVIIDATHAFATTMPGRTADVSEALHLPRLRLLRPAWAEERDWTVVPDLGAAAAVLPPGARAVLATGRSSANVFAARRDCRFWLRSIEPAGDLPPHVQPILMRPPLTEEAERALLAPLGATHLVTKNSGGDPARLAAARALGLAIIAVAPPPPPPGPRAETVKEALAWIRAIRDAR